MTSRSQKPIRAIRALGLLKVLQNHQKRNKDFNQKFLKNRTSKNEETYKTYKNLFESITKRSNKKFFSEKLQKFKVDVIKACYKRDTWKVHHKIN